MPDITYEQWQEQLDEKINRVNHLYKNEYCFGYSVDFFAGRHPADVRFLRALNQLTEVVGAIRCELRLLHCARYLTSQVRKLFFRLLELSLPDIFLSYENAREQRILRDEILILESMIWTEFKSEEEDCMNQLEFRS